MNKDKLIIFDTTLRDGEQSPGASMNVAVKQEVAAALEALGVDVIEAGFPISSPGDFEAVKAIAAQIRNCQVCGLARAVDADIDRAYEALKGAKNPRIHTFIATSPIHMHNKLRLKPDAVVAKAVAAVRRARQYCENVEFSAEDAGRSDPAFLARIFEAVIEAGATTCNIPDTVGYSLPHLFGELITYLKQTIKNSDKAIFSVHCHNDLGLAVANSLAAIQAGARQVECTMNGMGERAGNAALEEIVMAVKTRQDIFPVMTTVKTQHLVPCSQLVSKVTGFTVQRNKAIVGENAFAHEAGIHQDGVLKSRETYEIMRAEDVGWKANQMILGKHSGRNAFQQRLSALIGNTPKAWELDEAFLAFKVLADEKHEIKEDDLKALIEQLDKRYAKK
jgi:2-isopropylmalate synthase